MHGASSNPPLEISRFVLLLQQLDPTPRIPQPAAFTVLAGLGALVALADPFRHREGMGA
jgi:hypothetical protein